MSARNMTVPNNLFISFLRESSRLKWITNQRVKSSSDLQHRSLWVQLDRDSAQVIEVKSLKTYTKYFLADLPTDPEGNYVSYRSTQVNYVLVLSVFQYDLLIIISVLLTQAGSAQLGSHRGFTRYWNYKNDLQRQQKHVLLVVVAG